MVVDSKLYSMVFQIVVVRAVKVSFLESRLRLLLEPIFCIFSEGVESGLSFVLKEKRRYLMPV
jgi:hypothetical protein